MTKNTKILLVEDDDGVIELYSERFSLENIDLVSAVNGKDGLKKLKKQKPDIILLDIKMPEMNGFEFLKEIKKMKEMKGVPVLLLTNVGESKIDMNSELTFALGIEGYLIKAKNTPDQVLERVNEVLDKKKK